jgi:uncharacterized glyoxalase superfamily protein PhnB
MLQHAIPVLRVTNSTAAEDFYCSGLGFQRTFCWPPTEQSEPRYFGVNRDGVELHISSFPGDGTPGTTVFVLVDDVDLLHRELLSNGVHIDTAPIDQTWGTREMFVKDADRNCIRFASRSAVRANVD